MNSDGVEHRFLNLGKYYASRNGQTRKEYLKTRKEYLKGVSEDYGIPLKRVMLLAEVLGSGEDHDALLIHLDELVDWNY